MHKISLNGLEFKGASTWSELAPEYLLHYARIRLLLGVSDLSRHLIAMHLFQVPYPLFKQLKECQMLQLHQCIIWLFKKNNLEKWLISAIKINQTKLYGPKNKLSNLTGEEFMYTEAAYEHWLLDQHPKHLDTLFAVLFRRKKRFSLKRTAFDPESISRAIALTKNVKPYVKYAVAVNYAGCRNLIISKHENIWKVSQEEYQVSTGKIKATSWASLFLDLAGDKFGTYQQTIKTNLWLLLADLDSKAKQAAELKKKS